MAQHEKVHVICENLCLEEGMTKEQINNELNTKASKQVVESLASGSPLVASSVSGMTDTSRVYVNTSDGHWYWYNGSSWQDGGVYQAAEDSETVNQLIEDIANLYKNDFIKITGTSLTANHLRFVILAEVNSAINNIDMSFENEYGNNVSINLYGGNASNGDLGTLLKNNAFRSVDGLKISYNGELDNATSYKYAQIFFDISLNSTEPTFTILDKFKLAINGENRKISIVKWKYESSNLSFEFKKNDIPAYATKEFVDENIVIKNNIYVSTASELKNAIDGIATSVNNNKANSKNIYNIYLNSGTYDLYDVIDKTNLQDQVLYKRGLEMPDYVNLYGIGNVTIRLSLPSTESAANVQILSTINTHGENHFENITFVAENCRYCVHDDNGGPYKNRTISFVNCEFYHNGNTIGSWSSQECYGAGYTGGRKGIFKNCYFYSKNRKGIYIHNSTEFWATDKFAVEIDSCAFRSEGNVSSIDIERHYDTSHTDIVVIKNCNLDHCLRLSGEYKGTKVFGGGNNQFDISNSNNNDVYLTETHNSI